jgi:DNA polymerase
MDKQPVSQLSDDFAAALAWWREAGVDCDFRDEPADWIAASAPPEKPAAASATKPESRQKSAPAEPQPPEIDRTSWPQELEAFAPWWLSEPWLDNGRTAGRVPPRGASGARLMFVVPEPEEEDGDRLLSGPQGRLLDAIVAAIGLAPSDIYIGSVLPRHTPMADWKSVSEHGMGEILAHHIKLVNPERIVAFGNNILPLFGNDLPNSGQNLLDFNHESLSIPLLAATNLAVLLARPRAKARLWRQWLDWTRDR